MKPYPIRLPDSLINELDDEAEERGLGTAEYVRQILRERNSTEENTQEYTQELTQRIEDVEKRLAALEAATDAESAPQPDRDREPSTAPRRSEDGSAGRETTPDAGGGDDDGEGRAGVAVRRDERRAAAEEAVKAAEVPGRAAGVERTRRDALLWAWDYLREHGHCKSSEIANATFGAFWSEDRLNYSVSSRYPGYGMWDGYLRDALKKLPGVEAPGRRGNDWFFGE